MRPILCRLRVPLVGALAGLLVIVAGAVPEAGERKERLDALTRGLLRSAQTAAEGDAAAAAGQAAQAAGDYWIRGIGADAPAWAKRIEFEWDIQQGDKPEFSILTVQPLFEGAASADTVFVQFRAGRDFTFGTHRTTINAGLGYRRLFWDNRLLVGANAFFDHEWEFRHSRVGFGAEARWSGFDLYANYYDAVSGIRTVAADTFEKALDGYDVELTAQLPYLPWARARGKVFHYDSEAQNNNVDGFSLSLEMTLHRNLEFEVGFSDDDVTRNGFWFVQLRFRLADPRRPVLAGELLFDAEPYRWRDMRAHTLDKVRRTNTITIERTIGSSVTISRGT